jgi:hypothetical protein
MTSNREHTERGATQRAGTESKRPSELESRRAAMHAAEGHAGSIPRGNQEPEHDYLGRRHLDWDRVLGH